MHILCVIHRCSMVLEYLPTWKPPKWPSFVGKYSSTMEHLDHLGYVTVAIPETNIDLPK